MLSIKNLSYFNILNNVSFDLNANQILTIIGPNGSGKTTLIKLILNLLTSSKGCIQSSFKKVSYVPQRLLENRLLPLKVKDIVADCDKSTRHQLGIDLILNSSVSVLSGGQRQRVLLARALSKRPDLLILDEPTQGVDFQGQKIIYDIISQYRTHGAILYVSHDLSFVMKNTDWVICLNGHICCQGRPTDVQKDPFYLSYTHHHDHFHT
jgi:zinc transport system ATP-binding protein